MLKYAFRRTMVDNAHKAANAMRESSLSASLKFHGFTPATMTEAADALTKLHTKVQAAKDALAQASAELQEQAGVFERSWSTYCHLVRGLTHDLAVRRVHGVGTPGVIKGPRRSPTVHKAAPEETASSNETTPSASDWGAARSILATASKP